MYQTKFPHHADFHRELLRHQNQELDLQVYKEPNPRAAVLFGLSLAPKSQRYLSLLVQGFQFPFALMPRAARKRKGP